METTVLNLIVSVLLAVGCGLAGIVWWVIRHTHAKVDSERDAREQVVTAIRANVNVVEAQLHAHELRVAREYVNQERLEQALKPLAEGVGRVEGAIERLFEVVDRKQDKQPGGGA